MPGLACSFGEVTRLELPIPVFLSDQPFSEFRTEEYTWDPKNYFTLLVRKRTNTPRGILVPIVAPNISVDKENVPVNIGGCPLECPFDPNENFAEAINLAQPESSFEGIEFSTEHFDPINLPESRKLIRKIHKRDAEVLEKLRLEAAVGKLTTKNPIYAAVDGSPGSKDLVMIGLDGEKFLELRMVGPYMPHESFAATVETLLQYHQQLPNVKLSAVSRHVHALYEKVHGEFKADGKVFIEFVWADPKILFEQPPAQNARVKLAIKPLAGDANPFLKNLWDEIESLQRLLDINNTLDMSDLNRTHQSTNATETDSSLTEEIKLLLNQQSTPNWDKGFDFSDSLQVVLERVSKLDRSDVDFTDRIWTILRKATTTSEIMECFHQVFSNVEAKLYRPYLFPGNDTILGSVLKGVLSDESRNFRAKLTPALAMQMTLDCGINKLFKDYSFILKMCRLAETQELDFFSPQSRLFNESVMKIKKLHCVLEVLCLSKERLSLPMAQQEAQTRTLFQYFAKHPLDWNHTFHFDVPMSSICNVIVGLQPVYWNLKFESTNLLRTTRTNVIFSRDFFIGHARKLYRAADGTLPRGFYMYVHRIAQQKTFAGVFGGH